MISDQINPVDRVFVTMVKALEEADQDLILAEMHNKSNKLSAAFLNILELLSDESLSYNGSFSMAIKARKIMEKTLGHIHIDECFSPEIYQI